MALAMRCRRGLSMLAALFAALPAGCAATDWALSGSMKAPPPVHVVATWKNSVFYTPDPANNGKMSPGLAGRIHLFGSDLKHPMLGDGGLAVELDDDTGKEPVPLERWEIDAATLKRLEKRDLIGWGYTVYLPWTKKVPDASQLSKVRLRVRYQPTGGSPLFTEGQVTLAAGNGDIRTLPGPMPAAPAVPPAPTPQVTAKRW